jgi:hypothetical protein
MRRIVPVAVNEHTSITDGITAQYFEFGDEAGTGAVLAGTGVGVVAALAVTRLVSSLLFGVRPTDALTFLSVIALLLLVALRHE